VDEMQAIIAQAPWWLCSAVVHLVIIVSLTLITFATIEPPRKRIVIEIPQEQLAERVEPNTKVDVLNEEKTENVQMMGNPIETRVAYVMQDAQSNAPVLAIEAPTANELSKLVDKGGMGFVPSTFGPGGVGTGLISSKVMGSKIGMNYDDVMDVMSENIVKEIQHNDLLVVLIFDETKSLLEDRMMIMQKLTRVVNDLKKELRPREAARLKWAVIGYAPTAMLWLQPTDKIEEVLEGIRKMKVDDSGIENTCGAIRYAVKTLSPLGKKMYLVVISDGVGKDTVDDKIYMQALHDMQAAKARFFVFGRESAFQQASVFEWLRDSKG